MKIISFTLKKPKWLKSKPKSESLKTTAEDCKNPNLQS